MAGFDQLAYIFESLGVMDFLLPFIIVFTIMYAVLLTMPLFKDNKKFSLVLALAIGLLFVVPHITGDYPLGVDPVEIMNNSLPQIALVAVSAFMMLILLGLFGHELSDSASPFILLIAVGFTVFIFGASLGLWNGPYNYFSWWNSNLTELLIIILFFGGIVWFITGDEDKRNEGPGAYDFLKGLTDKKR